MSSPIVGTSYADGSTNTVRPESRTYPDGRVVSFDYGDADGMNDRLSRIGSLVDDDDTVLAEYQYLGLGAVVQLDSPEADLRSTLVSLSGTNDPDTGDIYSSLDRFGRVTDVRWRDVSGAVDLSRVQYGYDRASNRTFRKNPTDTNSHHDWSYGYDGLQRLKHAERGTLASPPTGVTSPQFAQCWSLDATGNWAGFRQANTGNPWDLVQARTANAVNEITAITNSTGAAWAQPAYDAAGNMTTIPQPENPGEKYTATYDAWNRLVKLVDPATGHTVQENVYDARGYRIIRKTYTAGTLTETRHYYYTNGWRGVEERLGTTPDSADAERQHVWGVRYIDDLVCRDRTTENPLDERLYACQDGNWNTTAVVATDGTVQERYEYDPYGDLSVLAPDFTPRGASSFDWNITYAGYRFDAGTGLYQVRFRFLHPLLMWTMRDPIRYQGGDIDLYSYAGLKPTLYTDPSGRMIMVYGHGSTSSTLKELAEQMRFLDDVLEALQAIIGDCARLTIENKRQVLIGGSIVPVSGKIGFANEKPNCKNDECWQLLKDAITSSSMLPVHWAPTSTATQWDRNDKFWPFEGDWGVMINTYSHDVLWEIDPAGGYIGGEIPFNISLWHELIGHGSLGLDHPPGQKNAFTPSHPSDFYDKTIECENKARKCVGLRERVHQYFLFESNPPVEGGRWAPGLR